MDVCPVYPRAKAAFHSETHVEDTEHKAPEHLNKGHGHETEVTRRRERGVGALQVPSKADPSNPKIPESKSFQCTMMSYTPIIE